MAIGLDWQVIFSDLTLFFVTGQYMESYDVCEMLVSDELRKLAALPNHPNDEMLFRVSIDTTHYHVPDTLDAMILVYSCTSRESIGWAETQFQELKPDRKMKVRALVALRAHLPTQRVVLRAEGEALARELGIPHFLELGRGQEYQKTHKHLFLGCADEKLLAAAAKANTALAPAEEYGLRHFYRNSGKVKAAILRDLPSGFGGLHKKIFETMWPAGLCAHGKP